MAELQFERPVSTDDFRLLLADKAPLPWRLSSAPGCLLDAAGAEILAVDHMGDLNLPDAVAAVIAMAVLIAVNACGGFAVQPAQDATGTSASGDSP